VSEKIVKISNTTNDLLEECIVVYRKAHKEMNEIKISRNKIIYEIAKYYLP
jgi:hypothetical protein